jgi:hypothetical protein
MSSCRILLPQQACSLQLRPWSGLAVPTISRMMPGGCLLDAGILALTTATSGAEAAATALRFARAAAHMVQYLPPLVWELHAPHIQLESEEEEAMVCGCGMVVVCGCLFYVEQEPRHKQKIGQYSTYGILGIARKLLSLQEQLPHCHGA